MLPLAPLLFFFAAPHAVRLAHNPIVTPESSASLGDNINGPSLIAAPSWIARPLGRYYLYFAHHQGKYIRLAYADQLTGPWKIYEPGVLHIENVPLCHDHIASPDAHVDEEQHRVRLYFHCPAEGAGKAIEIQKTGVALSEDGLHFVAGNTALGGPYFRVFRWGGQHYAIARSGVFFRSPDGLTPFQQGPALFHEDPKLELRHAAVDVAGNRLSVYFSRIGDRPERILVSRIELTPDWMRWTASPPETVIAPEKDWEGADGPLETSKIDLAPGRVRELRDPAIFHDAGKTYLLYTISGESGIAIAELRP